jgi:hypothetical protein
VSFRILLESMGLFELEEDPDGAGLRCDDPRFLEKVREGVCPLCDAPLDPSPELLAVLTIPCSSPACNFVLRPHGKLSRISH